jgi:hypothetical protein
MCWPRRQNPLKDAKTRWVSLMTHKEGVGLLHETQRWNVLTFFEFQSNGGEGEVCEYQMLQVRWKGKIFFKWISLNTWRNMEFKGNTHVVIPHSVFGSFMIYPKNIICCIQLNVPSDRPLDISLIYTQNLCKSPTTTYWLTWCWHVDNALNNKKLWLLLPYQMLCDTWFQVGNYLLTCFHTL